MGVRMTGSTRRTQWEGREGGREGGKEGGREGRHVLEAEGGGGDLHHVELGLLELLVHETHGVDVVVVVAQPGGHAGLHGHVGPLLEHLHA